MDLFGENDEEALIANLREMVNKYLFLLKVDNFTEYKKQIFKESQPTGESKLTICTDFIYLRQLLILLIKVDQPFYGLPLDPIKIFIESRGKQLKQLEQMYDLDETSKMQELMVFLLYEINLLISTFIFAGESSICEVIVSDYFDASQKKDIFEIYKLIVYLNPDLTPL